MKHVDPASEAFTLLQPPQQARIYAGIGWSIPAIADEFGVTLETVRLWLNPDRATRRKESRKAWKRTAAGRASTNATRRRRWARLKAEEDRSTKRTHKLTKDQIAELRGLLKAGEQPTALATRFGLSKATITYHRQMAAR